MRVEVRHIRDIGRRTESVRAIMRYVDRSEQAIDHIDREIGRRLARVGFKAEGIAKRRTRVVTGNARRSVHTVVVGPGGERIDGGGSDENGRPVPDYPATGRHTAYVGSNCGYYKFLELKDGSLAGALAEAAGSLEQEFRGIA